MDHQINILDKKVLSDNKYTLTEVHFRVGAGPEQKKEVYYRGNSTAVLLYNREQQTVILTKQLRLPTYLNGNADGRLVETCAGMIDAGESPETCIRREAIEETGYLLENLQQVCVCYMSPASVTEKMTLYVASYTAAAKVATGGGLQDEHEDIEVLEMPFDKAFTMIADGSICDAKTIILLLHLKAMRVMEG
ncbi:MAG: NUDIX domain-containing protein [Sphingobacteriales bacterium]|nr:MAG: NUDIX domain-containing protein [Sphingobacteriales bacterium]